MTPMQETPEDLPPFPSPSLRRRRWPWAVAAVVIVAAAASYWYWSGRATEAPAAGGARGDPSARALPVVAALARKGSIDVYLNALGTVTPRNVVVVHTRVDGQLMSVAFEEGQLVRAGDLLAEVDPRPFQVQLTQAVGQMAKDQALLKNAQLDLERYQTLLAQDSISKQQVDTQAALVRQYEGTVQSDQGAIDSAKLQLTYSRVTAPIAGRVGLRQVDPGNVVHASDANGIVVIARIAADQRRLSDSGGQRAARHGADADRRIDRRRGMGPRPEERSSRPAGSSRSTTRSTRRPARSSSRPSSRTTNLALFPNQFVNIRMLVETLADATLVPSAAIQRGAPGTFVFVVKDDHSVSVAPVKLGPVQGETTAIASGLAPGAMVVVDGTDKLREGAKVELITRDAQAAPPAGTKGGPRGNRPPGSGPPADGERRKSGS